MKRLIAFVSVIALIVCCLASCDAFGIGGGPADKIEAAEASLEGGKYTTIVTTTITTDNEELKAALEGVESSSTKVIYDGESSKVLAEISLDGLELTNEYVLIDGVLYRTTTANSGTASATVKEKAAIGENDIADLTERLGSGLDIGADDFESFSEEDGGAKTVITCSKIKDEPFAALTEALTSRFESIGGEAVMVKSSVYYTVEFLGGELFKTVLGCYYAVAVGDASYPVTVEIETFYDYSSEVSVTAPADATGYESVTLDTIVK